MNALSRRQFLVSTAVVSGGMALGFVVEGAPSNELSPWVTINADDTVTIQVATPEIGNGTLTQVCQIVAEELHCAWGRIKTEYAPIMRDYRENGVYDMGEGPQGYFSGRSTTPERLKLLLQVGASARERLKLAAAQQWKVPVSEVDAKDSVLTHKSTGRTLKYGQVAAKAASVKLEAEPALKPESAWTLLGKTTPPKMTIPAIVNGSAVYGMDVRVPGMVYAALRQSPVHGGKVKHFNADAVKKMPGVLAVVSVDASETKGLAMKTGAPFGYDQSKVQSAVAVIAEHYWQAKKGLDALQVEWEDGAGAQWKSTEQMYQAAYKALDKDEGAKVEKTLGDPTLLTKQKKVVEATYLTPFSEQACMEPLNSTALVTDSGIEVWHPSQQTKQAFWVAANEAGVTPDKVTLHQTHVGGGFGRRLFAEELGTTVAIARKIPGRPVHVIWSREEMTRQGRYRPMVAARFKAGLDESGMPKVLTARQAAKGHFPRLADSPYYLGCVPNVLVDAQILPIHVMTGAYRGPGYNTYAFMVETFIDECAQAAGIDPLEYRLKLLAPWADNGWAKILNELKDKSGWGKSLPKGTGQGVAIANWGMVNGEPNTGTTVGVVATVEVTKSGLLKIHALDVAFDTGKVVNKDAVLNEVQGGTLFGLNMTLNEEMNVKDGRMVEGNYDQYPMLRMGDAPKINIHWGGLTGNDRFAEIGEPPVGPVGPAVGNAIFKATGKRIRSTPFRKHDLSWI